MDFSLSDIVGHMRVSEIRELSKYATSKDIVSFGGGMPDPVTFPKPEMKEILDDIIDNNSDKALQYGNTNGLEVLRAELKSFVKRKESIVTDEQNMIVTAGSQQGLYALGRIFIDPGETIITESPTYVGAVSAFNANLAKLVQIGMDSNGIIADDVDKSIRELKDKGRKPKFIYVIPNFQNPTGVTLSLERRKHLLDISEEHQIPIVEDNPYGELRYHGSRIPTLKSLDRNDSVIYLGSFSKIMSPGLRLGYIIAPKKVADTVALLKQALDLSTNSLSQFIAAEYLKRNVIDKQVPKSIALYKEKRDVMLSALEENFSGLGTWTKPEGGMFVWATMKEDINTSSMLIRAVKNGVIYVSGPAFTQDKSHTKSMRLNFTFPPNGRIIEGVKRLSKTAREETEALVGQETGK